MTKYFHSKLLLQIDLKISREKLSLLWLTRRDHHDILVTIVLNGLNLLNELELR